MIYHWVFLRYAAFQDLLTSIDKNEGGIDKFSQGYKLYGATVNCDNSITWQEWAPAAESLSLVGDFSKKYG